MAKTMPFKNLKTMTNQSQNLFIVEDNQENAIKLHSFLKARFGTIYNIFTFTNAIQAISNIDKHTSIIVLDYDYFGEEGNQIVGTIKTVNPNTKVIILANNDDIQTEIEAFVNGADNYILKQKGVRNQLSRSIFDEIKYQANYIKSRYSVSQAVFFLILLISMIAVIVALGMEYL